MLSPSSGPHPSLQPPYRRGYSEKPLRFESPFETPLSNLHLTSDCFPKDAAEVPATGGQTRRQDVAPRNNSSLLVCDGF